MLLFAGLKWSCEISPFHWRWAAFDWTPLAWTTKSCSLPGWQLLQSYEEKPLYFHVSHAKDMWKSCGHFESASTLPAQRRCHRVIPQWCPSLWLLASKFRSNSGGFIWTNFGQTLSWPYKDKRDRFCVARRIVRSFIFFTLTQKAMLLKNIEARSCFIGNILATALLWKKLKMSKSPKAFF